MTLDECRAKHRPRQLQVWIAWMDAYGIYPSRIVKATTGTGGYTMEQLISAHKFHLCRNIGLLPKQGA